MNNTPKIKLYNDSGQRLYVNTDERQRYFDAIKEFHSQDRMYLAMLYWTGCRLSEPLTITAEHIDLSEKCVIINTLKQRRSDIFRKVPLPESYLNELNLVFDLRDRQKDKSQKPLWDFSRRTAHRYVTDAMTKAKITGPQSSAKGLRHGFAVHCVLNGIPLPSIQKWMGHASMETTAIYLQVTGKEERELAERIW